MRRSRARLLRSSADGERATIPAAKAPEAGKRAARPLRATARPIAGHVANALRPRARTRGSRSTALTTRSCRAVTHRVRRCGRCGWSCDWSTHQVRPPRYGCFSGIRSTRRWRAIHDRDDERGGGGGDGWSAGRCRPVCRAARGDVAVGGFRVFDPHPGLTGGRRERLFIAGVCSDGS